MDLGKLMSMWEESKREVEEYSENCNMNENFDEEFLKSRRFEEKDDEVNQELKYLKEKIKKIQIQ